MLSRLVVPLAGAALILASLAEPPRASACTVLDPDPALVGVPEDGATDVPTDVVLHYRYPIWARAIPFEDALVPPPNPGRFTLENERGKAVEFTMEPADIDHFQLRPERALAPHTEYVVRAEWTSPPEYGAQTFTDEVRFTTGAGPYEGTVPAPEATLTNYHNRGLFSTCTQVYGTCVVLKDPGAFVVARFVDLNGQVHGDEYSWQGAHHYQALTSAEPQNTFRCIELRTRAPNGALSDPVQFCGDDFPRSEIEFSEEIGLNQWIDCTEDGLVSNGRVAEVIPPSSSSSAPASSSAGDGGSAEASDAPIEPAMDDAGASPPAARERPTESADGCRTARGPGSATGWFSAGVLAWMSLRQRSHRRSRGAAYRSTRNAA